MGSLISVATMLNKLLLPMGRGIAVATLLCLGQFCLGQAARAASINNLVRDQRLMIGINEGTPDGNFIDLDPDASYETSRWGFGHGNRMHKLVYWDLSGIASLAGPGESFEVSNAVIAMTESENLQYTGEGDISAMLVDWVSGAFSASYNSVILVDSTHGNVLMSGDRTSSTTVRFPDSGVAPVAFDTLLEGWLNGTTDNFGLLIEATAVSPSSVDVFSTNLSFDYVLVPEPRHYAMVFAVAVGALLALKRQRRRIPLR